MQLNPRHIEKKENKYCNSLTQHESAETPISGQGTFFIGSIQTKQINKLTHEDEQKLFVIYLPITTKKHHKWKYVLHFKANSGAQKSIMTKKLYTALTIDKFFNELDDPECQLKGHGTNAKYAILDHTSSTFGEEEDHTKLPS